MRSILLCVERLRRTGAPRSGVGFELLQDGFEVGAPVAGKVFLADGRQEAFTDVLGVFLEAGGGGHGGDGAEWDFGDGGHERGGGR